MQIYKALVAAAIFLVSWQPAAANWRALGSSSVSSDSSSGQGRGLRAMPLKTCYNDKLPLEVG